MTAPLVAGNWKMNTTVGEGVALAQAVRDALRGLAGVDVALLPPFTHIVPVRDAVRGCALLVGAQDVFWERSGAFTGEVSPGMLREWCDLVLVGHSERRHLMGETDEQVGRKFAAAAGAGLRVMVAVGETQAERDAGETLRVLERQLAAAFASFDDAPGPGSYVIAYEPVWAIGTGRTATPQQAEEACAHVQAQVERITGDAEVQVLYGGSVTPENAAALFAEPHIGGALVGGASLRSEQFCAIAMAARQNAGA